jgi:ferredoxin
MSVEITFEPVGLSGLVAEGAYLSDAARRMGVSMPLDCKGSGQCISCQVQIYSGAALLSAPTEAERNVLGEEGLLQQQRLACQVRIDRAGELVVYMNPAKEKPEEEPLDAASMRKKFGELALDKKITTLMQLEALTMFEAMNAIVDKPLALGEKLFDRFYSRAKAAQKQARSKKKPPEHRI